MSLRLCVGVRRECSFNVTTSKVKESFRHSRQKRTLLAMVSRSDGRFELAPLFSLPGHTPTRGLIMAAAAIEMAMR